MLGKLIKHEWRSQAKVGGIILLAILAVTLLGCVFLSMPVVSQLFAEGAVEEEMEMQLLGGAMLIFASLGLYLLLLMGAMYGIMIYQGVHFYRTMYTDQGYLVHTLPVTPHQILISKTLVSGIWMLLVNLSLVVSMIALVVSLIMSMLRGAQPGMSFGDFWTQVVTVFEYEFAMEPELKGFFIAYLAVMGVSVLLSPFFSVIMMFGGLTIGQLSKKYKVMMSILSYIGVLIVYTIFTSVVSFVSAMQNVTDRVVAQMAEDVMPTSMMTSTYGMTMVMMVLMGGLLYFLSHYIISKKLNMD